MEVIHRTIDDVTEEHRNAALAEVQTWMYAAYAQGVLIIGTPVSGYYANIDGRLVPAVSDGNTGLDGDIFHFEIINPLG